MTEVDPLGTSPIIADGATTIAEPRAFVEYRDGKADRWLGSSADTAQARRYTTCMYYAERSLMPEVVTIPVSGKLPLIRRLAKPALHKRLYRHLVRMNSPRPLTS